jgi:hypothetical protein
MKTWIDSALRAAIRTDSALRSAIPHRLTLLVMCCSLTLLVSCGTTKTTDTAVTFDKADVLAAKALELQFKQNKTARALELLAKAAKQAPGRAEILWLQFELCAQVLDCNTEQLEAQLLKLDPTNGAVLLGGLARAQRDGNATVAAAVLDSISRSQRIQIYWNSLFSKLTRATVAQAGDRPQPVTRALNEVNGWVSGLSGPTLGPILAACTVQRANADANTNARCIRIAGLLLQSDTYIAEQRGLEIASALLGAERAQQIAERSEASEYQRATATTIINAQLDREKLSNQLVELMAKLPREQDVYQAIVRWGGGETSN